MDNVGERTTSEGDGRLTLAGIVAAFSVVLTIAILFIVYLLTRTPPNAPIEIHPPPPTPTRGPTATPAPLSVYVTGAVKQPGMVQVESGARVQDAIDAAGGAIADANLENYNLAAALFDGQHLQVPAVGETVPPAAQPGETGGTTAQPININSATAEELIALPGVGEATAAKIVTHRQEHGPFTTIEEIMDVPGIGEGKFNGFKDMITVGP